jgi:hypothetical protein
MISGLTVVTCCDSGWLYNILLYKAKIDLTHTHPVVTCVTLPNIGTIPLIGGLVVSPSFTKNLISLV